MKLEEQVCSLEIAQKLKELGVKQESLFWYEFDTENTYKEIVYSKDLTKPIYYDFTYISTFTVAELGEMLYNTHWSHAMPNNLNTEKGRWSVPLIDEMGKIYDDTEVNCRAKMLIYLLEK